LNKKILFAVLLMIAFSIVILLWFFSWETPILLMIVSAYLLILVPIVIALLIAEYAERRKKHAQSANKGGTQFLRARALSQYDCFRALFFFVF
jgi:membrane protein YdbS with pleckstrin-like domain